MARKVLRSDLPQLKDQWSKRESSRDTTPQAIAHFAQTFGKLKERDQARVARNWM